MDPILYLVATPIGTLGDFSKRAQEVLKSVGFIACEDTRHSGKLLSHFDIHTRLESLHEHNEVSHAATLYEKLLSSPQKCAALISDAGMPCVSDPGSRFVKGARERGIKILTVPGPSALPSALAASGFLQPRSVFSGFLSRTKSERREEMERWKLMAPCIAVCFESPQRICEFVKQLPDAFDAEIEICVSREISKQFEEHIAGTPSIVLAELEKRTVLGECVVTLNVDAKYAPQKEILSLLTAANMCLSALTENKDAKNTKVYIKEFAIKNGLPPKELYNKIQELKKGSII